MIDPGDAGPFARSKAPDSVPRFLDPPDHLMSGDYRQQGRRRSPLNFIKISVADTAHGNPEKNLALSRAREGKGGGNQRSDAWCYCGDRR
jgi:hypothetical protein